MYSGITFNVLSRWNMLVWSIFSAGNYYCTAPVTIQYRDDDDDDDYRTREDDRRGRHRRWRFNTRIFRLVRRTHTRTYTYARTHTHWYAYACCRSILYVVSAGQLRVQIDFLGTAAATAASHWVSGTRSRSSRRRRRRRLSPSRAHQ